MLGSAVHALASGAARGACELDPEPYSARRISGSRRGSDGLDIPILTAT